MAEVSPLGLATLLRNHVLQEILLAHGADQQESDRVRGWRINEGDRQVRIVGHMTYR